VGLADLRPNSPTFKTGITLDLTADTPQGLFIPVGVAHGFYALTDMMLVYVVNQYYNGGKDENGVAWDDPQLGVNWDVQDPILSKRDMQNPRLEDIAQLPQG
jgi:dTDP-4-dehydrorhamnose 3,5-epimerase